MTHANGKVHQRAGRSLGRDVRLVLVDKTPLHSCYLMSQAKVFYFSRSEVLHLRHENHLPKRFRRFSVSVPKDLLTGRDCD